MVARKRKVENVDVSGFDGTSEGVTVHGVITELSPVKVSCKNSEVRYFRRKVSDGVKTIRVVSFEPCLRSKLEKSRVEGSTVSIVNCQIKQALQVGSSEYEIVASKRSKVEASPTRKFELPANLY